MILQDNGAAFPVLSFLQEREEIKKIRITGSRPNLFIILNVLSHKILMKRRQYQYRDRVIHTAPLS
jgi:hypothetical protein